MTRPLLICMTPVRNEAWILHAFLKATSLWADYIIIADQMSTDGSRDIAMMYPKVILIENNNQEYNEASRQKLLIDRARKIEGKKILFGLDADEIFSANFNETEDWQKILNSNPGDVFEFKWMFIADDLKKGWITPEYYPWAFHDDGIEPHGNYARNIHSMRIPYPIQEKQLKYINNFYVLHLHNVSKSRILSKSRFYKFVDYTLNNKSVIKLSRMYSVGKIRYRMHEIDSTFIDFLKFGFNLFDDIEINLKFYWFDNYINDNLNTDNIKKYSKLDIWDKDTKAPKRSLKTRFVHWYLHKTTDFKSNILIRILDKILIKFGI